MAEVKSNVVTRGLSGMLGKTIVFRQSNGKTYVTVAPKTGERESTQGQIDHRSRFQEAVFYAKNAILEPETKALYQTLADKKQMHSAFAVAVADFFNAPDIKKVDLSKYSGALGSSIAVKIIDDFMVKQVQLEIYGSDGTLVESGFAEQQADGLQWIYSSTTENSSISGRRIVVKASDLPGNISQQEEIVS